MAHDDLPLGREVSYPDTCDAGLLAAIPRSGARTSLGIGDTLPFFGEDIWNAWEVTWLRPSGLPDLAALEIRLPATSPNIVESKSLKLYLGSFAMTTFDSRAAVVERVTADLESLLGCSIGVRELREEVPGGVVPGRLPGTDLDQLDIAVDTGTDTELSISCDPSKEIEEELHTQLFRSLCPVTAQPDYASVLVSYRGPKIDPESLLAYLVSFRRHQDFHESCVERIFLKILADCSPEWLCVNARFLRRGGIDINPWRSTSSTDGMPNKRLWRQ